MSKARINITLTQELIEKFKYLSLRKHKISLRGIYETGIWMSEDFDEPLQDFKDYMP